MNIYETIKARALEALRADNLPTEPWALKNRVGVTVLKANTALLNECLSAKTEVQSLGKVAQKNITRDILKELTSANH